MTPGSQCQVQVTWPAGVLEEKPVKVYLDEHPGAVQADVPPELGLLRVLQLPANGVRTPFLVRFTTGGGGGLELGPISAPLSIPCPMPALLRAVPAVPPPVPMTLIFSAARNSPAHFPEAAQYVLTLAIGGTVPIPVGAVLAETTAAGAWYQWLDSTGAIVATGAGRQAVDPEAAQLRVMGNPSRVHFYFGP
jgi:hypothetical protein